MIKRMLYIDRRAYKSMFHHHEQHFIDSSVFLSIIFNDNHRIKAKQYFSRVGGGVFECYVSHLVVGEIAVAIRDEYNPNTDYEAFYSAIEKVTQLLKGVKLHTPQISDFVEKLQTLKGLENRVFSTDTRIVAEATTSNAKKLVTFDTHYNTKSVNNLIEIVNLEDETI